MSAEELKEDFPEFPGMSKALKCDVTQGQMLYLPSGTDSMDIKPTFLVNRCRMVPQCPFDGREPEGGFASGLELLVLSTRQSRNDGLRASLHVTLLAKHVEQETHLSDFYDIRSHQLPTRLVGRCLNETRND